jgi:hypothetical protein
MGRKKKPVSLKRLKQLEKESMRQYAQWFIDFFDSKAKDEKIAEVAEAIKAVIVAYEDFWQGRVPDGVRALQEAAQRLNQLPSVCVRLGLGVSNSGEINTDPEYIKPDPEKAALSRYGDRSTALDLGMKIQNTKDWLGHQKENFPIGVCRYCSRFFMKTRKDARYCSEAHATYARIKSYRQKKKRLKDHSK